jgi:hypothetical protein
LFLLGTRQVRYRSVGNYESNKEEEEGQTEMSEGEFKKRRRIYLELNYPDYRERAAMELMINPKAFDLLNIILNSIDEAKKEFPDIGELTNITVSRFEMAAQDWFVKWFGSEEKKGEKSK